MIPMIPAHPPPHLLSPRNLLVKNAPSRPDF